MQGGQGIPHFYWYGEEGGFNVMVIELLGPDLERLLCQCKKSFSIATSLSLADQLVNAILN